MAERSKSVSLIFHNTKYQRVAFCCWWQVQEDFCKRLRVGTPVRIYALLFRASVCFTSEGVKRSTPAGDLQRSSLASGKARTENEEER